MKYVARLRAINVGGRNLMSMSAVRGCLEQRDFERVTTYIQSGNILFESDVSDVVTLATRIEQALAETFGHTAPEATKEPGLRPAGVHLLVAGGRERRFFTFASIFAIIHGNPGCNSRRHEDRATDQARL